MTYAMVHPRTLHRTRRPYVHPSLTGRPAVNVRETDEAYFLDLIAPGRDKSHFTLSVNEGRLTIEVKAPEVTEETNFKLREFTLSDSSRSFELPKSVNGDAISASYEQGILTVTLPKRPEEQPRQIVIE